MARNSKWTVDALATKIHEIIRRIKIVDFHTHQFDPKMEKLVLWGIDAVLTYHYLIAEFFRTMPEISHDKFYALSIKDQADLVWKALFVDRFPSSEACRGVITILAELGLDPAETDLDKLRKYWGALDMRTHTDNVLDKAGISTLTMTNDLLDPAEAPYWAGSFERDPRFLAAMRMDSALLAPTGPARLRQAGYAVEDDLTTPKSIEALRRYVRDGVKRMDAKYLAISLPGTFTYPEDPDKGDATAKLIHHVYMHCARELGIPASLMIGVHRAANPALRMAGDIVDVPFEMPNLWNLARNFGDVRIPITLLSSSNQHDLAVAARKFNNLWIFGLWWFLNIPQQIETVTRMRLELLGTTFTPQHSDSRVLEHQLYKWQHSLRVIIPVLAEHYMNLAIAGRDITEAELEADLRRMFHCGAAFGMSV